MDFIKALVLFFSQLFSSKKPVEVPKAEDLTPWMTWGLAHEGEKEVSGDKANPFITDCFKYTSLKNHPMAESDETAWCAAYANAALKKNGYKGTNSAAAKSFDDYGTACELKYGAVVTIKHVSGGRHVTFFHSWKDQSKKIAICFGGNQSNALRKSAYNLSGNKNGSDEIIGVRWPVKA